MKLRNTADHPISFDVDGQTHRAPSRGLVTPDVPRHKIPGVLKHHHLPVKLDGDATPEDIAMRQPAPAGERLFNTTDQALSFHVDGEHFRALPFGHVVPDIHPAKIPGVLRSGLPLKRVEVSPAAHADADDAPPAEPPVAPAGATVPADADNEDADPGDPPAGDTSPEFDPDEEVAALTDPDEPGDVAAGAPVVDGAPRGRRGRRASR